MPNIDVEKIINGTPQKRLLNSYEKMKENYTRESAQEYLQEYSDKSLPFILENSRYIFSEPFYGLEFYTDIITDKNSCLFLSLESELDKITGYIDEFGNKMPNEQKSLYESVKTDISDLLAHTKNTRILSTYISENVSDDFELNLASSIYDYKKEKITCEEALTSFNENMNPVVYFTYAPLVMEAIHDYSLTRLADVILESLAIDQDVTEDKWKSYIEACTCMNKLACDDSYKEEVRNIPNKRCRGIFEHFMNEDISKLINDKDTIVVNESDYIYGSSTLAVNELFNDVNNISYDESANSEKLDTQNTFDAIAYEAALNLMVTEYRVSDDLKEEARGYSILKESCDIETGYKTLLESYNSNPVAQSFFESNEDSEDDDIDVDDTDEEQETGKK